VSWHVNDLLTDADLVAYESAILDRFGQVDWQTRRTKALEDWLFPILKGRGFDPYKLHTRYDFNAAFSFITSGYTDIVGATKDTSPDDVNLAAIFATAGSDAMFLGSEQPFMGVSFRLTDAVSAIDSVLSVAYWNGGWEPLEISDGTERTSGKTFSGGGSVTWTLPTDWSWRSVNNSGPFYWVKVTVSATPTGATATQIGAIRSSALRAPVTFRTLQLIFQEAPTSADGPWREKAEFYKEEADLALQRALPLVGGEFDTDDSGQISDEESGQTAEESGGGPYILERY